MVVALVIGTIVGLIFNKYRLDASIFKPFGDIFLNLIKMLVVPLLMSALIAGTSGMSDIKKLGRVATKAISLYAVTTTLAILLGLACVMIFKPGVGLNLNMETLKGVEASQFPGVMKIIVNMIPVNVVSAMSGTELVPVILFSIFFGICMGLVGEKAEPVVNFIKAVQEIMFKMTAIVMMYAPIGAGALIAGTVGSFGVEVLIPLIKIVFICFVALIGLLVLIYLPLIAISTNQPLSKTMKILQVPILVAFSTTSSLASIPANLKAAEELGVDPKINSFLISLGSTMNSAGTAMYSVMMANFLAQVYGVPITTGTQINIILISLLLSMGIVGIPGMMLIILSGVLSIAGIPLVGISLIAGVDRIIDMGRTPNNVVGDIAVALAVDKSEKNDARKQELRRQQ